MAIDRARMAEKHEADLAGTFGGRATRGSGNQWSDPNDTRDNHFAVPFALSFQAKSTLGNSISLTREIIAKCTEEAGGERPALGLRYYRNERLDLGPNDDWVALRAADLSEILLAARAMAEVETAGGVSVIPTDELDRLRREIEILGEFRDNPQLLVRLRGDWTDEETEKFRAEMERQMETGEWKARAFIVPPEIIPAYDPESELPEDGSVVIDVSVLSRLLQANAELAQANDLLERAAAAELAAEPPAPVALDTIVVYSIHTGGEPRMAHQGVHVTADGRQEPFTVNSVRVERTIDNKPRLLVNDTLIQRGELYLDGRVTCRVGFGEIVG